MSHILELQQLAVIFIHSKWTLVCWWNCCRFTGIISRCMFLYWNGNENSLNVFHVCSRSGLPRLQHRQKSPNLEEIWKLSIVPSIAGQNRPTSSLSAPPQQQQSPDPLLLPHCWSLPGVIETHTYGANHSHLEDFLFLHAINVCLPLASYKVKEKVFASQVMHPSKERFSWGKLPPQRQ